MDWLNVSIRFNSLTMAIWRIDPVPFVEFLASGTPAAAAAIEAISQ